MTTENGFCRRKAFSLSLFILAIYHLFPFKQVLLAVFLNLFPVSTCFENNKRTIPEVIYRRTALFTLMSIIDKDTPRNADTTVSLFFCNCISIFNHKDTNSYLNSSFIVTFDVGKFGTIYIRVKFIQIHEVIQFKAPKQCVKYSWRNSIRWRSGFFEENQKRVFNIRKRGREISSSRVHIIFQKKIKL